MLKSQEAEIYPNIPQTLPCYLHLTIHVDESAAEDVVRFPENLQLDHPSLEEISIKRVKSVEKACVFPSMDLMFIRGQFFDRASDLLGKSNCGENSGLFECVQVIRQQSRFIKQKLSPVTRQKISSDGYLIFSYKTMEDMCTKNFAASWKTWTGARLLCQLLPAKYSVKRLSFFKKVNGLTSFAYVLIVQIADLMMDCAPALNVLNCIKPKICAFVAAYRIVTFKVDAKLCNALNVSEDQHLYVHASLLKVKYSNHTAFATYPGYNEFRNDDEKPENKSVGTGSEPTRKSSETQTDPVERPTARRTLPRTISIYDFPSMKNSTIISYKEASTDADLDSGGTQPNIRKIAIVNQPETRDFIAEKKGSPIPVALVHPLPSSPTGVWVRKKPKRKLGSVMFEDSYPGNNDGAESPIKSSSDPGRQNAIEKLIMELVNDPLKGKEDFKQKHEPTRRAHSEVRTSHEWQKLNMVEDDLLQRLKMNYFNSPDYTSSELRTIDSD
ncbi:unnamed protein product [Nippostrongylus brasiliensis]|uniref:DUF4477 domain-containing protein n=1 Tax=Nippostrongylus brasiliensis TaxID=27835 RepID=A0A0N4XCZ7_NIPBR|nr:unnamed protein product [Nippostrongylus brasiliensis]